MNITEFQQQILNYQNIDSLNLKEDNDINLHKHYISAKSYIESFNWVNNVLNCWIGLDIEDILAVFLFQIDSDEDNVDEYIWVVVGDIPSIYVDIQSADNIIDVLECYIYILRQWIDAIENKTSLENCYPVNVEANLENAKKLGVRLDFIENEIIPLLSED